MVKKRLDQYKGRLNAEEIALGMNACMANAKRLFDAAKIMFRYEDYALAASLAILSIEESGKTSILRALSVAKDNKDIIECWKDYRSHVKKNVLWVFHDLVVRGARKLDDFKLLFDENAEHPYILDQIKQISFYTDCLGNAHWSMPWKVIDKNLASLLIEISSSFIKERDVTETEVTLWIKHLRPVWKKQKELMELGLVNWFKEMQEKGLISAGKNDMEKFIVSELGSASEG